MNAYPLPRIVVIGLGNEFGSDAAAGLIVSQMAVFQAELKTFQVAGASASIIDAWKEADASIVICALQSGGLPGALLRMDAHDDKLCASAFQHAIHAGSLREAITMARGQGSLPPHLLVLGIEGANFDGGASLSPAVERAVKPATLWVGRQVHELRRRIMREFAIIKELLDRINAVAAEQSPARVVGVTICLGALSRISPDRFRECFREATVGTNLDGVHVDVERVGDEHGPDAEAAVLDTVELED